MSRDPLYVPPAADEDGASRSAHHGDHGNRRGGKGTDGATWRVVSKAVHGRGGQPRRGDIDMGAVRSAMGDIDDVDPEARKAKEDLVRRRYRLKHGPDVSAFKPAHYTRRFHDHDHYKDPSEEKGDQNDNESDEEKDANFLDPALKGAEAELQRRRARLMRGAHPLPVPSMSKAEETWETFILGKAEATKYHTEHKPRPAAPIAIYSPYGNHDHEPYHDHEHGGGYHRGGGGGGGGGGGSSKVPVVSAGDLELAREKAAAVKVDGEIAAAQKRLFAMVHKKGRR
jgi:hypothetical protein